MFEATKLNAATSAVAGDVYQKYGSAIADSVRSLIDEYESSTINLMKNKKVSAKEALVFAIDNTIRNKLSLDDGLFEPMITALMLAMKRAGFPIEDILSAINDIMADDTGLPQDIMDAMMTGVIKSKK